MSIAEKLAAARAAGAAKPKAEGGEPAPEQIEPESPTPEVVEESSVEVVESAPERKPSLGRPLTLAEKLAAARSGGAVKPAGVKPAPAPKPAPAVAPSESAEADSAETPPAAAQPSKPALPTGRPLTLAEKLAAARAGGASSGGAPAAKPTAAKATAPAAKPAAAKPAAARELPPLDKITDPRDLAEAARRAGSAKEKAAAAAKEAPAGKAAPAKKLVESKAVPPKPGKDIRSKPELAQEPGPTRRALLSATSWMIIGWTSFVAGLTAFTLGSLRFFFPNVLAEPPSTYKVGLPTGYEPESVDERFKGEAGFWIVRSANYDGVDKIYALASVCTHLGCPPNWLGGEQKFKCPCHGSGFYVSGVNFEGPAPRPLERYKISVGDDGQLVVDKSEKFQEELKQWSNPDSFVIA
jgi:cytochrome b6-f complex iron-sulfur subunit